MEVKSEIIKPDETKSSQSFMSIFSENKKYLAEIEKLKNKPVSSIKQYGVFSLVSLSLVAVAGLFLFQIVAGVLALGLSALAIFGAYIGFNLVKMYHPLMIQKMNNDLLNKRYQEARENSLAQLGNYSMKKAQDLQNARVSRDKMGALVETLKVSSLNAKAENKPRMEEIYIRVENAYKILENNIKTMDLTYKDLQEKIANYRELSEFSNIANEAMSIYTLTSNTEMERLLSIEAFRSIDLEFNKALISVENLAKDIGDTQ